MGLGWCQHQGTAIVERGYLPIDNNAVERAIRPPVRWAIL
ncbi:IS66 family transposase [Pseudomonas putida]